MNELRRSALSRFLGKRLCVKVAKRSEKGVKHRYVKRFRVLKCLCYSKSYDRCLSTSKSNERCSEMGRSIREGLGEECHAMKSIPHSSLSIQLISLPQ